MPRAKRKNLGNIVYHVLNRSNGRLRIFKKAGDFAAFEAHSAGMPLRLGGVGQADSEAAGTGIDPAPARQTADCRTEAKNKGS